MVLDFNYCQKLYVDSARYYAENLVGIITAVSAQGVVSLIVGLVEVTKTVNS